MGFDCNKVNNSKKSYTCIFCSKYRSNRCPGNLEINIFRQVNDGYELSYPLQLIINRLARSLMISTKDVVDILNKEFGLKIDRTLLFKYAALSLLKQEQKISKGRAKGIRRYWEDKTPLKMYYIRKIIESGLTIGEVTKYYSMLYGFENAENLMSYIPQYAETFNRELTKNIKEHLFEVSTIEATKFRLAAFYMAAFEAGMRYDIKKLSFPVIGLNFDYNNPENSRICVYLFDQQTRELAKKVIFKKGKVEIMDVN